MELSEEPIIDKATESGISVPELSQGAFRAQEKAISDEQSTAKSDLANKGVELVEKDKFSVAINGFSAEVKAEDLEEIAKLPAVKKVYLSREYERPAPVEPSMVNSVGLIGIEETWGDLNYKGEGMVVAIIDTGVDYDHKDMKITDPSKAKLTEEKINELISKYSLPGRYINDKVPYGYDYHDKDIEPKETAPSSQHGMHVAGTVAANGDLANNGIKGVAPEAQILAMKVFSDNESMNNVFSDSYLRAIEESVMLGADALNMSLGAPAGIYDRSGESAEDVALNNAVDNGIICAIAAGNDRNIVDGYGKMHKRNPDLALVGSPSTFPNSFAVASFENTKTFSNAVETVINGENFSFAAKVHESSPKEGFPKDSEYVYVGLGATDADYEGKDVSGKVALIQRGAATYTDKKNLAIKHGATAAIIFNHEAGGDALVNMLIDPPYDIPVAFIGHSDGMRLVGAPEGTKVTLTVDPSFVDNPSARKMSTFSSWGPSSDLRMKPEILAPGGNIYSTQNNDEYGVMSGTSMATPHVAGASAVVKQALKEKFPNLSEKEYAELTKQVMMNTAIPQKDNGTGYTYSVMQQGAGMMNVHSAITTPVHIDVTGTNDNIADGKLELKEIYEDHFVVKLTLHNTSNKAIKYDLKSEVLKEAIEDDHFAERTEEITSIIKPKSIKVKANSTITKDFTISFDGLENNQLLNGFIHLENKNHPKLTVPFIGFYGNWNEPRIIDGMKGFEDNFFPLPGFYAIYKNNQGKEVINPLPVKEKDGKNVVYFSHKTNIMPVLSVIRNAENLGFNITNAEDKELVKLNSEIRVRKVNRLGGGKSPYFFNDFMKWDGNLRKGSAVEGELYNYNIKAQLNYDADAQVYKYPIVLDKTAPEVEFVKYDKTTRTIDVRIKDALSGTAYLVFINPNNTEQLEVKPVEQAYPEFKEGDVISYTLPEDWDTDKLIVGAEDAVLNLNLFNLFDLQVSKDTPRIDITSPKILTFQEPEVNVSGTITNTENLDKVILRQVDEKGNVIGEEVEAAFEKDGDKFVFNGKITVEGEELIYIQITAISGSLKGNVAQWIFVDKTAPTIEISHECNPDNEKDVKLTFHVKDNFWAVMVDEIREDGSTYQRLLKHDESFEKLERKPTDVTFTHDFELENVEEDETFYFKAYDFAGNETKVSYSIKSGECAIVEGPGTTEPTDPEVDPTVPGNNDETDEPNNPEEPKPVEPGTPAPENPVDPEKPVNPEKPVDPEKPVNPEKPEDDEKPNDEATTPDKPKDNKPGGPDIDNPVEKPYDGSEATIATVELSGKTRYETAIKISTELFRESEKVVIASGEDYPDALAASVLAAELNAPLLLSTKSALRDDVKAEIARLKAKEVLLIGGENTLDANLEKEISALELKVERIADTNRYKTAAKINEMVKSLTSKSDHVILANGRNYADALAAAPYAGLEKSGILLSESDKLDEAAMKQIEGVKKVTIIGGLKSISKDIADALVAKGIEVKRVSGSDRYNTANELGKEFFAKPEKVVIASGENYPDALAGSLIAIKEKAPILLVKKDHVSDETIAQLKEMGAVQFYLLGGENTISTAVKNTLKNIYK